MPLFELGASMKVITRAVLDWDGHILEEESYEYSGPVADCKSSGSAPQPVDPYQQAAAQYGLATGTADYNARLNRTNSSNPLGSNTWSIDGTDSAPSSGAPGGSGYGPYPIPSNLGGGNYGFGFGGGSPMGGWRGPTGMGSMGGSGMPSPGAPTNAPIYSQQTSLTPWANDLLSSPIDTSQIPGMPGGPSLGENVNQAENSVFNNEMQLLAPQQAQEAEGTEAKLINQGAVPGTPAYDYGMKMLGLTQGGQRAQVANQAVTTGLGELPMFYGLGSTSLQNQLAERQAPISEYEALTGNPVSQVSAATPDIGGAFNQQYQGQLASYNAQQASNNATTGGLTSLAGAAIMAFF
jgi:hypothetical protein